MIVLTLHTHAGVWRGVVMNDIILITITTTIRIRITTTKITMIFPQSIDTKRENTV